MCSEPGPPGYPAVHREIECEWHVSTMKIQICCGTCGCLPHWGNGLFTIDVVMSLTAWLSG